MNVIDIVLLSVIGGILLFFLVWYCDDHSRWIHYCNLCDKSLSQSVQDVSFVNCTSGNLGAGKTTMDCGLVNYMSIKLQADAVNTIDDFHLIFWYLDFNEIDSFIFRCFSFGFYSPSIVVRYIYSRDLAYWCLFSQENIYDDFLVEHSYLDLLVDYIDAHFALFRNNFVYFNQPDFYSRVTFNHAYRCDSSVINIKDNFVLACHDYLSYMVIFEDEKSVSEKNNANTNEVKKEDSGGSLELRLMRHLFKGHCYYFTTTQAFGRFVLEERELSGSIFQVFTRKELMSYRMPYAFDLMLVAFISWLYKFVSSFFKNQSSALAFQNRPSFLRKIQSWASQRSKFWYAHSFVRHEGIVYHSSDDVGKLPENCAHECNRFSYVFPITFCYGSADTYGFHFVADVYRGLNKPNGLFFDSGLYSYALKLLARHGDSKANVVSSGNESDSLMEVF